MIFKLPISFASFLQVLFKLDLYLFGCICKKRRPIVSCEARPSMCYWTWWSTCTVDPSWKALRGCRPPIWPSRWPVVGYLDNRFFMLAALALWRCWPAMCPSRRPLDMEGHLDASTGMLITSERSLDVMLYQNCICFMETAWVLWGHSLFSWLTIIN